MADSSQQPAPSGGSSAPPPAPTPPPAPASTTPAPAPREQIEAKRMGFDPLRPFRYASAFIWGTIKGGLQGLAKGGRLGLQLGLIIGLAGWFFPALGLAAVGTSMGAFLGHMGLFGFYGFAGGAVLSGSLGLIAGGPRGVGRAYRREKYADELAVKQEARARHRGHGLDYQDRYALQRNASAYNFDRLIQQDTRTSSDVSTYWQDRVGAGGPGSGRGM